MSTALSRALLAAASPVFRLSLFALVLINIPFHLLPCCGDASLLPALARDKRDFFRVMHNGQHVRPS